MTYVCYLMELWISVKWIIGGIPHCCHTSSYGSMYHTPQTFTLSFLHLSVMVNEAYTLVMHMLYLMSTGVGWNIPCASDDCLTSRSEGLLWPRELWFLIHRMCHWATSLSCAVMAGCRTEVETLHGWTGVCVEVGECGWWGMGGSGGECEVWALVWGYVSSLWSSPRSAGLWPSLVVSTSYSCDWSGCAAAVMMAGRSAPKGRYASPFRIMVLSVVHVS